MYHHAMIGWLVGISQLFKVGTMSHVVWFMGLFVGFK